MTIGLLVQLALITLLRKTLRKWTESKCGVQSRFLEEMEGKNWKVLHEGMKKTKMKQKRSNARLEQHFNGLTKQRKKNHHSLEDIVKLNRSGGTLQKSSLSKGDMSKVFDKKLSAEQSSDEINIDVTQSLESKSDSKEGQVKQRNIKETTSLGSKEEFAKPKESSESKSFDSKEELAEPSSSKEGTTKPAD
nr:unnamed protein product [Haemonchus contortus]